MLKSGEDWQVGSAICWQILYRTSRHTFEKRPTVTTISGMKLSKLKSAQQKTLWLNYIKIYIYNVNKKITTYMQVKQKDKIWHWTTSIILFICCEKPGTLELWVWKKYFCFTVRSWRIKAIDNIQGLLLIFKTKRSEFSSRKILLCINGTIYFPNFDEGMLVLHAVSFQSWQS